MGVQTVSSKHRLRTLHSPREIIVSSQHVYTLHQTHILAYKHTVHSKGFHLLQFSQWIHSSSLSHSLAESVVIVRCLILLWQLIITPLVLRGLAIQHGNNTASSICQALSVGDTFSRVSLTIRTRPVTVFTCSPSTFFRLIPYTIKIWLAFQSLVSSPLLSSVRRAGKKAAGLLLTMKTWFKLKLQVSTTFSFKESGINILCSRSCSHKVKNM